MSQSYTPLYRKYRPYDFGDLVGQEVVVKALSNAINLEKISHAYLFCGSRGTGKTSAARILAKSLNCLEGPTPKPCGKCANCIDITNGSAIDVTEIDAASNNGVEDARDIIEKVQFVPVSGKFKIFIIDEVHMLSNSAFNTLLKTLEEPPENLVFILATTEPHKILDTIISRCQRFDFRKIKIDDIEKRLKYIAQKENIKISNDAIEMIAQKSTGGLRDAIALLDQASVLGLAGNEVTVDDILSISGSISQDNLYALTEALGKKEPEKLITLLDAITNQGNEPMLVLKELVSYFRNLLLIKSGGNSEQLSNLLGTSEQFIPKLKEQSEFFEVIEIAQIIEKMAEYEVMLRNTTNQNMWLEVILISILHRQDIKVIKDLESRVSALEAKLTGGKVEIQTPKIKTAPVAKPVPRTEIQHEPQPTPQTSQTQVTSAPIEKPEAPVESKPESTPASNGDFKEEWMGILNNLDSFPAKNFFIGLAKPVEVSATNIVIALKSEALVKGAKDSKKVASLEEAASKFYGQLPKINLITFDSMQDVKKKPQSSETEVKTEPTQEKVEASKPIESKIEPEPIVKVAPKVEVKPQQVEQNLEPEIETLEEVSKETLPTKEPEKHAFSDDVAMVMDLFQGKIIE